MKQPVRSLVMSLVWRVKLLGGSVLRSHEPKIGALR